MRSIDCQPGFISAEDGNEGAPMTDQKSPGMYRTIEQVLAQVHGPIPVDELATRVLSIYPSSAKNPLTSLRSTLRLEHPGKTLVFLDRQTIVPLRVVMQGVRFRIPVTRQEATRGVLCIEPAFDRFRRQGIPPQDMQLLDAGGRPLAVRLVTLKQRLTGALGSFTEELPAFALGDWYRTHRIRRNDSVLVTIEDWECGRFRLEHEPAKRRRQQDIERQNQELAHLLFDMLEAARNEQIYVHQAIPTAYARLSAPRGYPGDHWTEVIANDARMQWDGFAIHYSDVRSPLDEIWRFDEREDHLRPEEPYSQEQARQVYRFKAALQHRPELWRRPDIQGGQTLADFDAVLRDAFHHDTSDHLGGFWKLVRRGTGRRFREVDLGDIDPLGGGSGADQHVAGLGLKPGDELKYVYDFGDWIEHRLTLEEVAASESGVTYARIVAQNQPRHRYCQACKSKKRKTVATWICLQCSDAQQREVLVCEDCLIATHEDHDAEGVMY
jgi:hypothetical protein